jgi:putative membrane protein
MKVLVLCIDRDDDLGVKTGIEGPVIGRHENVRAALALGLADPEDADTNTILAAISTYDEIVKRGINADVATILGDVNVGYQSDIMLTKQLEEALEVTGAKSVILVTNGAEDEYIFPMISSRIRVDSVRNVMVKQSKSIESTWYYIMKQLKDSKMRKRIIAPIGLILLAIGIIILLPLFKALAVWDVDLAIDELSLWGVGALGLGIYLVQSAFRLREGIQSGVKRARHSVYSGDVTIPMFILAIIIFVLGLIKGYNSATVTLNPEYEGTFNRSLLFIDGSFYWLVGAFLIFRCKDLLNPVIRREPVPKSFWLVAMSLIAIAFLVLGGVHYLLFSLEVPFDGTEFTMYTELAIGLGIAIAGGILQRWLKSEVSVAKESWRR